jgi:hypothetical protein
MILLVTTKLDEWSSFLVIKIQNPAYKLSGINI